MSWIDTPPGHPYPGWVRLLLRVMARRGPLSGSTRLWARAPRPWLAFQRLYRAVDRADSPLDPGLRSLVMVRVAQLEHCPFCIDLNGARALERGVTEEQLQALGAHAGSPLFDARQGAALAFAEAVATGEPVTAEVREALRAAFSDDAIVELTALVAFQGMSARFNAALDVPAEGRCRAFRS